MLHVRLYTTTQSTSKSLDCLRRLLNSLDRVRWPGGVDLRIAILFQNQEKLPDGFSLGDFVDAVCVSSGCSLSSARNLLIDSFPIFRGLEAGVDSVLIGFPDDDAWYPEYALEKIIGSFNRRPRRDRGVFVCRYGTNPISDSAGVGGGYSTSLYRFCGLASSNTMFFLLPREVNAPRFDERLGVGALVNGGEDLRFALEMLCMIGPGYSFSDHIIIGHRDKFKGLSGRYYPGSITAIRAVAGELAGARFLYYTKKLFGIRHVLSGSIGLGLWWRL